ncbi:MAG TPA: TAXI family TRAP transporter solute-binding subunit [Stellaceae bacterium]|nr:TAXI family TRAP transporter solute-binding subunit [Stellaceae bacterium]
MMCLAGCRAGRKSRWRRPGLSLFLAAAAIAAPLAARATEALDFFRIGTAATTGTYFQIGGVLASAISKPPGARDCERGGSCGVPGLVAVAQASQGSLQNALALGAGQLESALIQSDVAYWAYADAMVAPKRCRQASGEPARPPPPKSQGPIKNLRVIAGLFPEDVHVVVRADSPIRSLRDLKGRPVALGEPESGTLADARLVLEAAGLSECEVKAQYLRLSEAADALVEGRIDAFFVVAGYPVPAVVDVATATPTRLLPIPPETAERLAQKFPFFGRDVIPAGSYPGLDTETPTLSTTALWATRAEIDADLVYAITKSLWSDATRRLLEATHPAGRRIRLATALDGLTIPLHPGAARYYREVGMKIPDGL